MNAITDTYDFVDADFDSRLKTLMGDFMQMLIKHHDENFSTLPQRQIELEDGNKNIKILIKDGYSGGSCYGFVAKMDYESKALGKVKKGDILKAASFRQPAKWARSNIYDSDFGLHGFGIYGMVYLRG